MRRRRAEQRQIGAGLRQNVRQLSDFLEECRLHKQIDRDEDDRLVKVRAEYRAEIRCSHRDGRKRSSLMALAKDRDPVADMVLDNIRLAVVRHDIGRPEEAGRFELSADALDHRLLAGSVFLFQ